MIRVALARGSRRRLSVVKSHTLMQRWESMNSHRSWRLERLNFLVTESSL
jgi:hypothetical protein